MAGEKPGIQKVSGVPLPEKPSTDPPIRQDRTYRQRIRDLLTLFDISKQLNIFDLQRLVNFFLVTVCGHFGVRRASIVLLNGDQITLSRARGCNPETGSEAGLFPQHIVAFLQRAAGPVVIRFEDGEGELDIGHGLTFGTPEVICPILRGDETAGVILIGRKISNEPFSDEDLEFLSALASQGCVAIDNARFVEQLEKKDEQLAQAYRELKTLDQAKDDFIKIASHELNTPLTVVRLTTSLLLDGSAGRMSDFQRKLLAQIDQSSQRLQEINEDLIHLARSNYDVIQLNRETTTFKKVVRELNERIKPLLEKRTDIRFRIDQEPQLPEIFVDIKKYVKVFEYLVQNAIKYTPDSRGGQIVLSAQAHQDPSLILCSIKDEGIGIDPKYHKRVFTPFFELIDTNARSTDKTKFLGAGLGLGLAIVKDIIEGDHGVIWIESEGADQGTQVYFTILTKQAFRQALTDEIDPPTTDPA